jgi:hypothetical protein
MTARAAIGHEAGIPGLIICAQILTGRIQPAPSRAMSATRIVERRWAWAAFRLSPRMLMT